ncbi:MAG TPA: DUF885 domain-containing protein [Candidatus Nanopelagicales bacterium]|nr:DUF885 domain-containing protein [Candidatus Nanopelagicales bacterium]
MTHEWEFAEHADDVETTFAALADRVVDALLARDPVAATWLGDHRFDDRLPDRSAEGLHETLTMIDQALVAVDQLDDLALGTTSAVDLEILRSRLTGERVVLADIAPHTWDPLEANPGTAIHLLLARDFAPLEDRLASVAARLDAVPDALEEARRSLGAMPRVHVETAIGQFEGTRAMLTGVLEHELEQSPSSRSAVEPARDAALGALDAHIGWLRDRLESGVADGDPRLGPEKYAAKLWAVLDAGLTPDDVLHRAEADLARLEGEIARAAAEYLEEAVPPPDDAGPLVRRALDAVAAEGVVTNGTVLALCGDALARTTDFVRAHDLVTVPDLPVQIIEMPEIHRGVAVAYCDPPGALETRDLPTFFAVSPTPSDWDADQVASFYREYNGRMLHNLTVHEAMPGHVLQLAHDRAFDAPTMVRRAFWSGPFVEGWAVYAEQLMAEHGYDAGLGERGALSIRLQQLKMQLRMTINAILDVRVHTRGMTEEEAMRLMVGRGHQEEGEAVGKWRRALLTSAQLSTYYVGYIGVRDVVADLRAARPDWTERQVHDAVLAHGSPPPRHLRTLLGI